MPEKNIEKKTEKNNFLTEHITNRSERQDLTTLFKRHWKTVAIVAILGIVAAVAIFFFVRYNQASNTLKQLEEGRKASPTEVKTLIEKIGKLALLPKDEDPTIASVTDPAKLADQPFFINAKEGDKVLIYTVSRRAILYRPSENKIIEIAPLNINDNVDSSPTLESQQPSVKVGPASNKK